MFKSNTIYYVVGGIFIYLIFSKKSEQQINPSQEKPQEEDLFAVLNPKPNNQAVFNPNK